MGSSLVLYGLRCLSGRFVRDEAAYNFKGFRGKSNWVTLYK